MPHTFECELRWADIDQLSHVNNVRYLDYVAAARNAMFDGLAVGRAPVLRHRAEFVTPLVFRRDPVSIDSWVTDLSETEIALAHEVYDEQERGRTVYLRVSSVIDHGLDDREREMAALLGAPDHDQRRVSHDRRPVRSVYRAQVRPADLDERGLVRDTAVFEFLQESRVQYLMNLHTRGQAWTQHVVARTDVQYRQAIPARTTPYEVHSWVGHLGTRSFTICAEVRDAETVMAEATVSMVTFDPKTQRSAEMAPSQRARLEAELA